MLHAAWGCILLLGLAASESKQWGVRGHCVCVCCLADHAPLHHCISSPLSCPSPMQVSRDSLPRNAWPLARQPQRVPDYGHVQLTRSDTELHLKNLFTGEEAALSNCSGHEVLVRFDLQGLGILRHSDSADPLPFASLLKQQIFTDSSTSLFSAADLGNGAKTRLCEATMLPPVRYPELLVNGVPHRLVAWRPEWQVVGTCMRWDLVSAMPLVNDTAVGQSISKFLKNRMNRWCDAFEAGPLPLRLAIRRSIHKAGKEGSWERLYPHAAASAAGLIFIMVLRATTAREAPGARDDALHSLELFLKAFLPKDGFDICIARDSSAEVQLGSAPAGGCMADVLVEDGQAWVGFIAEGAGALQQELMLFLAKAGSLHQCHNGRTLQLNILLQECYASSAYHWLFWQLLCEVFAVDEVSFCCGGILRLGALHLKPC